MAALSLNTELPLDPHAIEASGLLYNERYQEIWGRIGFSVSIYFFDGWTRQKRDGLFQLRDEFIAMYGGSLTHLHSGGKRLTKFSAASAARLDANLRAATDKDEVYFAFRRLENGSDDDPALFGMTAFAFAKGSLDRKLSGLQIHVPPSAAISDAAAFSGMIARWAGYVGAAHGTAGLGAVCVQGVMLSSGVIAYPALMQYPALDYNAMGSYWTEVHFAQHEAGRGYDRVRSSNWLTILADSFVEQLGGIEHVRTSLLPGVAVTDFGGGVVLRAGALPELGDARRNYVPELYRSVSRLIRPIRFEDYKYATFAVPDGIDSGAAMRSWIRRMD